MPHIVAQQCCCAMNGTRHAKMNRWFPAHGPHRHPFITTGRKGPGTH